MRTLLPRTAAGCRSAGIFFLVRSSLIVCFFLPLSASSAPLSAEAEACLACHSAPGMKTFSDGTRISVQVNGKRFAGSVHGALGCTGCHSDVKLDSHPSAVYSSKQQFVQQVNRSCRACHGDRQLTAKPQHASAVNGPAAQPCSSCHGSHRINRVLARKDKGSDTQYCLTCHGKPITRNVDGKTVSLTIDEAWIKGSVHLGHECTDCHRSYSKASHPAPKAEATARELAHAASEACERCHLEKAVKEKDSIHAVVLARGDQRAPGCSDCHGSHQVGPHALTDTLDGVPCRKCHEATFDAYRTSVHGMTKPAAASPSPLCAACHTAHEVKPAMASRSPRDMCIPCHAAYEEGHRMKLPNPKAHLEMVACTACHVPLAYKRSIYLRFTDAASGKLLGDDVVQAQLTARGGTAGQIAPKELWQLFRNLNAAPRAVNVSVAVSMDVRRNAHYLAPKEIAVKQCEACHSADSLFFGTVAVATAGPDGREVLRSVDARVLDSAYGVVLLKRFYVMSGTRLTAMDYAGVLIILGGVAFPVLHGTARLLTRHLRQESKKPEGRGRS